MIGETRRGEIPFAQLNPVELIRIQLPRVLTRAKYQIIPEFCPYPQKILLLIAIERKVFRPYEYHFINGINYVFI